MNPIRASERIVALVAQHGAGAGVGPAVGAPLLTVPAEWYRLRESDDYQSMVAGAAFDLETGMARLPFRRLRVALPEGRMAQLFDGQQIPARVSGYGVVESDLSEIVALMNVSVAGIDAPMRARILAPDTDTHSVRVRVEIYARGEWSRADAGGIASFIVHPVLALAWYYNSGTMQPVIVSPPHEKSAGRSAKWVQARSYYTVVHRRHAANRADLRAGSTVADKSATLTAHARRAHARILRSPRWGASMGKRVWVRSCWVGPLEWSDAESRQVYRVANLGGTA